MILGSFSAPVISRFIESPLTHTRGMEILSVPSVHHHEVDNNRANMPIFVTQTVYNYEQKSLKMRHIGPHLSNEHMAENCVHDHFHARIGIYQFGHEHMIQSNLPAGLTL